MASRLTSACDDMSACPEPTNVVHEDVQTRIGRQDLIGKAAHLGLGRQVGDEHVDGFPGLAGDCRSRLLRTLAVASRDADTSTH